MHNETVKTPSKSNRSFSCKAPRNQNLDYNGNSVQTTEYLALERPCWLDYVKVKVYITNLLSVYIIY